MKLILFIILTLVNVILMTVKSIATIKCTKIVSSIINGIAYGLYTVVLVFISSGDISLWTKVIVTAVSNLVGVYVASWLFDKMFSQDIRWRIEVSTPACYGIGFAEHLNAHNISYIAHETHSKDWNVFTVFSEGKEDSKIIRDLLPDGSKYNISECRKTL